MYAIVERKDDRCYDPATRDAAIMLAKLLGYRHFIVRPSCYAGYEIVLRSRKPVKIITVCGFNPYYLYAKFEFPSSRYNGMGDWELEI